MVKTEFELNPNLLEVPNSLAEPRLRNAGLAWLDMALELWSQEVLSSVSMSWWRPLDGSAPRMMLSLDSSKNFRTRGLMKLPDAPALIFQRRERFDAALEVLMSRTTPEDIWAALANTPLAEVGAWEFNLAWGQKTLGDSAPASYPRFSDSRDFLAHLLQDKKVHSHPWL